MAISGIGYFLSHLGKHRNSGIQKKESEGSKYFGKCCHFFFNTMILILKCG